MNRQYCGSLSVSNNGELVNLYGWVDRRRDHGGVIFLDLRDRSGLVQITVNPKNFSIVDNLRNETVIKIYGIVQLRPIESINNCISTGEVEVIAKDIIVLNNVKRNLPFSTSLQDNDEIKDELRLKYRYLDIRRKQMLNNLQIRHDTVRVIREFLNSEGFIDVETPILTKSTPGGARDFIIPSRVYANEWYALPQSPQLFKQLLMVGGIEKYYQIARCFRDEGLRSDRQPEFTQLDMEISFMEQDDIISLTENLIFSIWKKIKNVELELPFPKMTWENAMKLYGTDKPDIRYDLILTDVSDLFKNSGFKVFNNAISSGGCVKCIVIPDGNALISNVRIKPGGDLFSEAIEAGSKGLAFIRIRDNDEIDTIGAIKDNLDDKIKNELLSSTNAKTGDLILFAAGNTKIVNKTLDRIRQFLARELNLISDKDDWKFLWVVDFPLFEFNEDEQTLESIHHPFCAPNVEDLGEDSQFWGEKLPNSRAQSYDLVLNGFELGGGSLRIHDSTLQREVFKTIGMASEESEEQFGFLLEALDMGAPPHGGIAFGLDRMIMFLSEENSIRDTIAFPKTQQARCLLTGAPSNVSQEQLNDVHVKCVNS
jgi:aspartyl-tRNA synthetase